MTENGTLKGRIVLVVRTEASWVVGCWVVERWGPARLGGGLGCRCVLTET